MATNIRWRKRLLLNGSAFTDSGSNGVRLYKSDIFATVGALVGSLTYESGGWWYIDIDIDSVDNGYFILRYTTDGSTYITINESNDSGDPIFINNEPVLLLKGGTMSGGIIMSDNSVTNVNSITFNDSEGTIEKGASTVQNQNLIDKTADETISGAWTHSGNCTFSGKNTVTGVTNFTTDKCEINDIIVQPYFYITKSFGQELYDVVIYNCDTKMTVIAIEEVHNTASSGACTVQVERLSGVEAIGTGDTMLSPAFDINAAAYTIQSEKSPTNASLAATDRIAIYVASGSEAGCEGVHITLKMRYGA